MIETWLEFTFSEAGVFISDWTHTITTHWMHDHKRDYWRLHREFTTIAGKTHTYHIKALGRDNEQIKALAIWYHTQRASGNIRTYRLD